ncbi:MULTISPECIES: RluA family pseudouridine synthase [unclassified Bacillus (in: firmicutes)]|uniref:RluA family pseudouridine synthase n=1 Tax=unclassified Bacillus (in: firmicutes) TaxID=185979 RepID=UPI0008E0F92A|nr:MULTISPECIES: RluA family pseudouridine synthase [unclassified Bacillus (in: firmicutes)]SFA78392.1 23S rRNA pseudouridine1911/1915/1917 synthase [Bacillus sp. UNCCL13]SFQ68343.1 23S rRNA pseudouridine1911/1915/1917 synthase [Bacillus sp. cl95]
MPTRFKLNWKIDTSDTDKLLKDFLKEQEISKTALTDIKFKGGRIVINGEDVNVRYKLKVGDEVTIYFPPEEPSEGVKGENIPLNIVYEDEYLLVIQKPAKMSTIPSREHPQGSLANALVGHYEKIGIRATSHIVTRLDRDTSGLVLVAKHRHTHHLLSKQQKSGKVKRTYEAFAEGHFSTSSGTIEEPIGRKMDSIIEREVREDGQYACTHFKVIQSIKGFTHLELRLETGRTHQIRVHLSHKGHPLVGDDLYGGHTSLMVRQALHCKKLAFYHPFLKKDLVFESSLPSDMAALIHTEKAD